MPSVTTKPTRFYCTLFDQNYLIKGVAMTLSLLKHSPQSHLFVLCMDDVAYGVLQRLALQRVTTIRLEDFERATPQLLPLKQQRSVAEYCWTCTPCISNYVLEAFSYVDHIVYLDADLLFFNDPERLHDEIADNAVSIIEHRFSKGFEESVINGKYNVQWVGFKRNIDGLRVLSWWKEKCLEWCFNRSEDGKFGDQKYLDCWIIDFQKVHVIQDLGAGVGPWNFASYQIEARHQQVMIDEAPLIFYHFHGYKMLDDGGFTAMPFVYMQNTAIPYLIYEPYRHALWAALHAIRAHLPSFSAGIQTAMTLQDKKNYLIELNPPKTWRSWIKERLKKII